jgi:hypothetical protein
VLDDVEVTEEDIEETGRVETKDDVIAEFVSGGLGSAWIDAAVLNELALSKVMVSVKSSSIIAVNSLVVVK